MQTTFVCYATVREAVGQNPRGRPVTQGETVGAAVAGHDGGESR